MESSQRKRIVYYDEGAPGPTQLGGGQLARLALMEHLNVELFEPVVVTSTDGELSNEARRRGIATVIHPISRGVTRLPRERLVHSPFRIVKLMTRLWPAARRLASILEELDADLVHPNDNLSRMVTIGSQYWYRIPAVIHVDNEWNKGIVDQVMGRLFTRRFDRLIAVSQAVHTIAQSYAPSSHNIVHIPTGVDQRRFTNLNPDYLRAELKVNEETFVLGTVGKMIEGKGQHIMLEALARVRPECADFCYCLVGDGPAQPQLRHLATDLGLEDRVVFLGHRQDVPQLLAGMDLVVQPSFSESFGLVLVESLLASRLVVATDVGGASEILKDGSYGWLVPPRDVNALAVAVQEAFALSPTEKARLEEAGREHAWKEYSLNRMVQRTEQIYLSVFREREDGSVSKTLM